MNNELSAGRTVRKKKEGKGGRAARNWLSPLLLLPILKKKEGGPFFETCL